EEAEQQVLPQAVDVPVEVVAHRGERASGEQPAEGRAAADGHVHLSVSLHAASEPFVGLTAGFVHHPRAQGVLEDHRQDPDHQQPARELRGHELPAQQDEQNDAELEDEVRAGELEEDCVGEGRAPAEQSACYGDGRIGAARARCAEEGREGDPAEVVPAQGADDRLLGDDGLHDRGDDEAERERPEDLPEHEEGHLERLADCVEDKHDSYAFTRRWTAPLSSLTLASPSPARIASATQCSVWSARRSSATLSSAALTAPT